MQTSTQIQAGLTSGLSVELGIDEGWDFKHEEHHRQCPNCSSDNVNLKVSIIKGKTTSSAYCYDCKYEDAASNKDDVEKMIDDWFDA